MLVRTLVLVQTFDTSSNFNASLKFGTSSDFGTNLFFYLTYILKIFSEMVPNGGAWIGIRYLDGEWKGSDSSDLDFTNWSGTVNPEKQPCVQVSLFILFIYFMYLFI